MKTKILLAAFVSLAFFTVALFTLKDYGISWDEPTHFKRGQAYLWYFITGQTNYSKLPAYDLTKAREDTSYHQRSIYQVDSFDFEYHLKSDGDHPPLNDILAALFNFLLYQKLGLMGDIESYHVFEILTSAVLVGAIFLFAVQTFGKTAGISAAIFLSTYPLFWAESHFNIKDPIETAFFTLTLFAFWTGVTKKKAKFILLSSVFAGVSLGTKFNILFIPFIILPWLFIRHFKFQGQVIKTFSEKKFLVSVISFPLIMFGIFFITWPFLWQDPIGNIALVLRYYKEIGTETGFQTNFLVGSWNTYALRWIVYTTQPLMLVFFVLGLMVTFFFKDSKREVLIFWFIWLIVPILRVSLPNTSIYGGVRQIMEYIPAMALIAGAGADWVIQKLKLKTRNYNIKFKDFQFKLELLPFAFCLLILIVLIIPIIRLHPNQNVYFNFLTGGLRGAVDNNIPAAGNSFGNAYWKGVRWINENVEKNAKVSLVQGTTLNMPSYKFRSDIQYSNYHWSGIDREGEYMIELDYNWEVKVYHYAWEYVEKLLEPVFVLRVEGVPILKIWKNDFAHTKSEFKKPESKFEGIIVLKKDDSSLYINLPEEKILSRVIVNFTKDNSCQPPNSGYIETSLDGISWVKELDPFTLDQLWWRNEPDPNSFRYMFAARPAKYIRISLEDRLSCLLNDPKVELVVL